LPPYDTHNIASDIQDIPPVGRFILDDSMFVRDEKTGMELPHFNIQSVAMVFFGHKAEWLRWLYRPKGEKYPYGRLVLDGEPLIPKRNQHQARYYTLADVERMAHALTQCGVLNGLQLLDTIMVIRHVSLLYGIRLEGESDERFLNQTQVLEIASKSLLKEMRADLNKDLSERVPAAVEDSLESLVDSRMAEIEKLTVVRLDELRGAIMGKSSEDVKEIVELSVKAHSKSP
jgi:hypothetical protein